jgi:chromosome segregation ATPase
MHANLRLVAQEEVELEQLRQDIATSEEQLSAERVRVAKLRDMLDVQQASYRVSDRTYTREQVREDLSRRFERIKEAEVVLAGKQRLLGTREQALEAAVTVLQRTRSQKSLLEDRIEGLQAQHRLVQAAQVGSRVQVDGSKLAQTEKLISDIKKRLDVAERVLAREGDFVQGINVDVVDEGDLLADVDAYLKGEPKQTDQAQLPATDAKPQPSAYRDLAEHGVQLN